MVKKLSRNSLDRYYRKWILEISKNETSRTIKQHIVRHSKEIYSRDLKEWSASMKNLIEIFDMMHKLNSSVKLKLKRLECKYKENPRRYTPPPLK